MSDIEQLFRSRQTVLEMIEARGYKINASLHINNIEDFKKLFYSKALDFRVESEGKEPVFVKWLLYIKIKPKQLKEIIEAAIEEEFPEVENYKMILISKTKTTTNVEKVVKEKPFKNVQLFCLKELIFNITKHVFVPKHELLDKEEARRLMESFFVPNLTKFPIMLKTDPISKFYDFKAGDVCRITRYSPTSGEYFSYRVVR